MTIESTDGTRNAEHGTAAVVLRSAAPGGITDNSHAPGTLYGTRNTEHGTTRPEQNNPSTAVERSTDRSPERNAEQNMEQSAPRPFAFVFRSRAERAQRNAEAKRNAETLRLATEQRNAEVRAEQIRSAEQAAAAIRRTAKNKAGRRNAEQTQIAPIPHWMQWLGAWFDRTLGALPLIAPLLVSGYFSVNVITSKPLNAPLAVALLFTLALEGGVWKLAKLLERTLLEGDSTISLRFGIGGYLLLISGMIFGHAAFAAYNENGGMEGMKLGWGDWLPAAATAVMSVMGVYIWSRQARFQHRVELRERGLIDVQAPKFSVLSWVFCPIETPLAFRHAIKYRISSPTVAVADRRCWVEAHKPSVWNVPKATEEEPEHENVPELQSVPALQNVPRHSRSALTSSATMMNGTERTSVERSVLEGLEEDLTGRSVPSDRSVPQRNAYRRNIPIAALGAANGNGTAGPESDGTQNAPLDDGTRNADGGTMDGISTDTLRLADNLFDVTDAYPDWRTKVPPVRAIKDAISTARLARGGQEFKSMGVAQQVAVELRRLASDPQGAYHLNQLRSGQN